MIDGTAYIHHTAEVERGATIQGSTRVWHLAHIRAGAVVGAECTIGRGVYIDRDVRLGDRCKIQNYACLYYPAIIGNGVFIGPHAVIINDRHPRAVGPDGELLLEGGGWIPEGAVIEDGASVGTGAIIFPGVTIGQGAMIGAGAIVTRDVPAGITVVGCPASQP